MQYKGLWKRCTQIRCRRARLTSSKHVTTPSLCFVFYVNSREDTDGALRPPRMKVVGAPHTPYEHLLPSSVASYLCRFMLTCDIHAGIIMFLQAGMTVCDAAMEERNAKAKADGRVLRYVATISEKELKVGMKAIPAESPIGRLQGTQELCHEHFATSTTARVE